MNNAQGISYISDPVIRLPQTLKAENFSFDFMAALTVMMVMLPQSMGYALIAGVNPIYGLYGAIVLTIVGAVFGSSNHLVTRPTNAISILIASAMLPFISKSGPYPFQILILLTFMVGVIQLALGFFKLGAIVNYVPHSLIVGFTAGAGALIAMQQLPNFFGVSTPKGVSMSTLQTTIYVFGHLAKANPYAFGLGATAFILVLVCKVIGKKFKAIERWLPGPLIGVIVADCGKTRRR